MRAPIFNLRKGDIAGILFAIALIVLVAVGYLWQGRFRPVAGTGLACVNMPKSGGPLCVKATPAPAAP